VTLPVAPSAQEAEDHLNPGIQSQLRQPSETLSQKKKRSIEPIECRNYGKNHLKNMFLL
jgi:hypothetical protein